MSQHCFDAIMTLFLCCMSNRVSLTEPQACIIPGQFYNVHKLAVNLSFKMQQKYIDKLVISSDLFFEYTISLKSEM